MNNRVVIVSAKIHFSIFPSTVKEIKNFSSREVALVEDVKLWGGGGIYIYILCLRAHLH